MSSRIDCPMIVLHVTKSAAIFADNEASISGSRNRAPIGISSKFALGRSGGVGGKPTPFAFNSDSIFLIYCCDC